MLLFLAGSLAAVTSSQGGGLPQEDMEYLRQLTLDVLEASRVEPDSNGGGNWAIVNTCGFSLVTPGKDTYRSYWIRDFSMALDSGLVADDEIRDHLILTCRTQNGPASRSLANGLHVPPWSIPDHINYDGRPTYYPGTYATGEDQGDGAFGHVPPIDDHYEFVHIAYRHWQSTRDTGVLLMDVDGVRVFDRLVRAFASPTVDSITGLAQTTETDRAVGFGFCDGVTQTGKLLFASLLRYRAAGELAEMAAAIGKPDLAPAYRLIQKTIRENLGQTFADPAAIGGWLRAATGLSREADVWGTLFALHLNALEPRLASAARATVLDALRRGVIVHEGAVRQVPTDLDFSPTTAWERARWKVNLYQNGGYWHVATGWLVEALWETDRKQALQLFSDMITHLRREDYRQGAGYGAPWEYFGRDGKERKNAVYLVSVALPYGILKRLE